MFFYAMFPLLIVVLGRMPIRALPAIGGLC